MYYVKNENDVAGCLCTDSFDANKPYSMHKITVSPKVAAAYTGHSGHHSSSYQPFQSDGPVNSYKQKSQYSEYQVVPQAYLPPTCGLVVEKQPASSCTPEVHTSLGMLPSSVSQSLQPAMYRKQAAACCGAAVRPQPAAMTPARSTVVRPIVRNTATTQRKRSAGMKPIQYVKRPSQYDYTETNREDFNDQLMVFRIE